MIEEQLPNQGEILRNDTRSDSVNKTNQDFSPIRKFERDINIPNTQTGRRYNQNLISNQTTQQPLKLNFDPKLFTQSQIPSYLPKYETYYSSPLPPKFLTQRTFNQTHNIFSLNKSSPFRTQKETQLFTQRQINPQDFKLFSSPDKQTYYSFTDNKTQNVSHKYRPLSTLTSPYSPINPQLSTQEGGYKQKYSIKQLYKRIERTSQNNNLTVLESQSTHNENQIYASTYSGNRPLTNYQYKLNSDAVKQIERPLTNNVYGQKQQKYHNLLKTNVPNQNQTKLQKNNNIVMQISEIKRPYFEKKYGERRMLRKLGPQQDPVVIMKTDWCSVILLLLVLLAILGLTVFQLRESFKQGKQMLGRQQQQQQAQYKQSVNEMPVVYGPGEIGRENNKTRQEVVQQVIPTNIEIKKEQQQPQITYVTQPSDAEQQYRPIYTQPIEEQYAPLEQPVSQQQQQLPFVQQQQQQQQAITQQQQEYTQPSQQEIYPQQQQITQIKQTQSEQTLSQAQAAVEVLPIIQGEQTKIQQQDEQQISPQQQPATVTNEQQNNVDNTIITTPVTTTTTVEQVNNKQPQVNMQQQFNPQQQMQAYPYQPITQMSPVSTENMQTNPQQVYYTVITLQQQQQIPVQQQQVQVHPQQFQPQILYQQQTQPQSLQPQPAQPTTNSVQATQIQQPTLTYQQFNIQPSTMIQQQIDSQQLLSVQPEQQQLEPLTFIEPQQKQTIIQPIEPIGQQIVQIEPVQLQPQQLQTPVLTENTIQVVPTTIVQQQNQPQYLQTIDVTDLLPVGKQFIQPIQTAQQTTIQPQQVLKQQPRISSTQIQNQQIPSLQQQQQQLYPSQQKQKIIFMQSPPQFFTYPENVISTTKIPNKQTIIQTFPNKSPTILQKGYDWEQLQVNTINFVAHHKLVTQKQNINTPQSSMLLSQRLLKAQAN